MAVYFCSNILTLIIIIIFSSCCDSYLVDNNPYRHYEILDKDGRYQLEWLVDWETSRITFNVTVRTRGYVGLGLSGKGKMSGADIVIGGVRSNGSVYFSDRHAIGHNLPVEDTSQDWDLHEAVELDSHTFLSFSRPFETCDEDHDLPINDDVVALIWAFGEEDDEIEYHHQNRGIFYIYLLDPDLTPRELQKSENSGLLGDSLGEWKVLRIIAQQQVVPVPETTYLCTLHKVPSATTPYQKQHIVGFRTVLPTESERRHIHHFLIHRCIPPGGRIEDSPRYFDHLLGRQQECYILNQPTGPIPTQYCTEVVHVWAVGGRPTFFPDKLGLPMFADEYFMFQVHYNNPEEKSGVQINPSLEIFYTDKLRQHDAGILSFGHLTPGSTSIMVPPNSLAHQIFGHCGSGCTNSILPPSGVRAFAGFLHTHLAGRGFRLLHIRNETELPWLLYDDNYNFDYQQIRILQEERQILPGDSLINRCIYQNTDTEGNATIGGFSTKNEMCNGYVWYYDRIPDGSDCRSEIRSAEYHNFLRILNTTWSDDIREDIVTSPASNAGLLVSQVANERMNWTLANRRKIQEYHRYAPQVNSCPSPILPREEEARDNDVGPRILQRYTPFFASVQTTPVNYAQQQRNTQTEFISTYAKDTIPYNRPSRCSNNFPVRRRKTNTWIE